MILDVPRGVTIGQFDVVTLNKGARDGLQDGNVLAVYKTGETVRDRVTGENVKIPDERSGLLMVFRTYDKLSYGLVLQATRSLSVKDKVRNPELKPANAGFSCCDNTARMRCQETRVSSMPAISPPSLKPGCVFICCRNSVRGACSGCSGRSPMPRRPSARRPAPGAPWVCRSAAPNRVAAARFASGPVPPWPGCKPQVDM